MQAGAVETIEPHIRRILAANPSPMTGPGTNTYLVGRGGGLLVIDPGPDLPAHLSVIMASLQTGEHIAAIVATHPHLDHTAGAPALARMTGAPVWALGGAGEARSPIMRALAAGGLDSGGEGVDVEFTPDRRLKDHERLTGDWGTVEVLHCPGHMAEHICLASDDVLFSGDHAMGWSTSLVSPPDGDMGAYMAALRRLMQRDWRLMLPGHGQAVRHVGMRLEELYRHRKMREAQILDALATGPATARTLAERLYTDTPAVLLPAAARNILAHLIDLLDRNEVTTPSPITQDSAFERS